MKDGYEIKDVGHSLSWGALHSFISNIEPDSALSRELDPDTYKWNTTVKTNAILADIYDVLALINANLVAIGSRKQAKKPKPYGFDKICKETNSTPDEVIVIGDAIRADIIGANIIF